MSVIEAEPIEAEAAPQRRELAADAERRAKLRRRADRAELRLALRDLAEALRGFIRAAPLTAALAAAGVGALAARKRRNGARRRVERAS